MQASGELVIQLVSFEQAEAMNASAALLPHAISEFEHCGIASLPSVQVNTARGGSRGFECRLVEAMPYPKSGT